MPWTVPSSPKRPCSAMNARLNRSFTSASKPFSDGSNACASTPRLRSAFSTMPPLFSDTSRSADFLPAGRQPSRNSYRLSHDANLGDELDAGLLEDDLLDLKNQALDIRGARRSLGIDDEVGVLLRHARAATRQALQPAGLDQARGMVARRVAEYAARVGKLERLRG